MQMFWNYLEEQGMTKFLEGLVGLLNFQSGRVVGGKRPQDVEGRGDFVQFPHQAVEHSWVHNLLEFGGTSDRARRLQCDNKFAIFLAFRQLEGRLLPFRNDGE